MKEIKAYLPSELVEQLSNQAKEQGINRSELIRNRLMANPCLLYTSPSPRDGLLSRMPSSA